ncbi:MAG: tryptophan--tRNA ligase [Chlamydiota bacterium]|nr:tryptophan--tRNA ligase [Chlamydiota bacterium]
MDRVLSGMRPTDRLHLGNYFGALANWKKFQEDIGKHYDQCFFMIVDWHALTTDYESTERLKDNINQVALDFFSAGLDPEKSVIFIQSQVKEHAELHLLLSMITPLGWLERNPTYKEQLQELKNKDIHTHGFLGYPVLQAADILTYKATTVPVGQDQLPHLELCRELVRRFNFLYKREVFPEPQSAMTSAPKVPGTDGRKMSKSYGNSIYISDQEDILKKKIMNAMTDPARKRRTDKGDPDICTVYAYHQLFSSTSEQTVVAHECREALRGCTDCKMHLFMNANRILDPIRNKRKELESKPEVMEEFLEEGAKKARAFAQKTLCEVRDVMGLPS